MNAWPDPTDVVSVAALPPSSATDTALTTALAAAVGWVTVNAPDRVVVTEGVGTGPGDDATWQATAHAAALIYRARGAADGTADPGSYSGVDAGGGWSLVHRLLGLGRYVRPRVG